MFYRQFWSKDEKFFKEFSLAILLTSEKESTFR